MSLELKKLARFGGRPGPLLLIIMDGVGLGKHDETNAVYMAKTPVLDELFASHFFTSLKAHGTAVGLPSDDDMGNSEVGHNAIGAGRVFAQGAKLVDGSIASGRIFTTPIWEKLIARGTSGATLHFIGLLSDGNVHSHVKQLFALLENCADKGVKRVRLHVLLDGRDVGAKTALTYIAQTEALLSRLNTRQGCDYRIASGGGRMVTTMDRYNADWSVVQRGWNAHVLGQARGFASATEAVETMYREDPQMTDQYLAAFVIVDSAGKAVGTIEDGDGVVDFNFRGDRAIEISRAFEEMNFAEFDRQRYPEVLYAGMMEYDGDLHIPHNYLVSPPEIDRVLSEYLCASGVPSFALSETQKYGHVTYFWNGNRSGYIDAKLEQFVEIPSDKIQFDKAPKMKALEIATEAEKLLRSGRFRFGRVNFANGDMVGHTGVMEAAIMAVETVDGCVGQLIEVVKALKGIAVITADHGNADEMFTVKNGITSVKTAHTLNPVPFVIVDPLFAGEYELAAVEHPGLSNLAATLLNLLGYAAPAEYDPSLITVK
ncbi:MAG TPA: 2,3-bisphosphoglycerate-independent phosphoglycerate mutase [bacterium]|nr:2,3-bisphosphoglycerate-independent phosphoglycerate mutase [bacterium]HPR86516.1 2,3-bisphosphoglycerate-independent phosphoglycerate mutase [bacterium]